MKKFIIAPIAAVVTLGLSGYAVAQDADKTGVDIYKHVSITNQIDYEGSALIGGQVGISQLGMAVIDNYQNSTSNQVQNIRNNNNADISGGSGNDLSGNAGVNVSAGDNNVQANNTALTVLGKADGDNGGGEVTSKGRPGHGGKPITFDKGASVDAEISSAQVAGMNTVNNQGNHNNAAIAGGSLSNAAGNLGVNVAAGSGNVQANNFALSYGEKANLAVSTVDNKQFTTGNITNNESLMDKTTTESVDVNLTGNISGSYTGNSVQSNDVYPEIWQGPKDKPGQNHPDGETYWGHADFDRSPADKGVDSHFEFADKGTIELGSVSLNGSLATINHTVGRINVNNASISGGSLNNAAGNIGVNVAAGTNNLQSNSMALSVGNF